MNKKIIILTVVSLLLVTLLAGTVSAKLTLTGIDAVDNILDKIFSVDISDAISMRAVVGIFIFAMLFALGAFILPQHKGILALISGALAIATSLVTPLGLLQSMFASFGILVITVLFAGPVIAGFWIMHTLLEEKTEGNYRAKFGICLILLLFLTTGLANMNSFDPTAKDAATLNAQAAYDNWQNTKANAKATDPQIETAKNSYKDAAKLSSSFRVKIAVENTFDKVVIVLFILTIWFGVKSFNPKGEVLEHKTLPKGVSKFFRKGKPALSKLSALTFRVGGPTFTTLRNAVNTWQGTTADTPAGSNTRKGIKEGIVSSVRQMDRTATRMIHWTQYVEYMEGKIDDKKIKDKLDSDLATYENSEKDFKKKLKKIIKKTEAAEHDPPPDAPDDHELKEIRKAIDKAEEAEKVVEKLFLGLKSFMGGKGHL